METNITVTENDVPAVTAYRVVVNCGPAYAWFVASRDEGQIVVSWVGHAIRKKTKRFSKRFQSLAEAKAFIETKMDVARRWVESHQSAEKNDDFAWSPARGQFARERPSATSV